jgi:hypothetical protein
MVGRGSGGEDGERRQENGEWVMVGQGSDGGGDGKETGNGAWGGGARRKKSFGFGKPLLL